MNLKRCVWFVACLAVVWGGASRASADESDDPAVAVRAVFAARCAGCHGPDVPKPKGRFGYVLDLRRVAGNPEMVIPSRPEESELWVLVQRGEMPPDDSPYGPLTADEKEGVRRWIAAGAPDVRERPEPTALEADPPSPSMTRRTLRLVGKFHLLLLHFPIALMVAACAAEGWAVWRRSAVPSGQVRFCLWLAACAAVPTVALGWLHAADGNGAAAPLLLAAHRWLGTTAGLWIVAVALVNERDARHGKRTWWTRLMLVAGVLVTAVTAHLGGLLDRGVHFFDW